MKKIYIMLMLVFVGTMALAQTSVWHGDRQLWIQGEGTESSPYLIESADNLAYLAYVVNKGYDTQDLYFLLTTDIDLNGSEDLQWVPIGLGNKWFNEDGCDRGFPNGNGVTANAYFRGHFDGGDHSISNIYINGDGIGGLFGYVAGSNNDSFAVIENVFVTSGYIKGNDCAGIVANAQNTLVSRCWNGAAVEGSSVGGIVGTRAGKVYNCYNVGNLSGKNVGGIVGGNQPVLEIVECYNKGEITATGFGGGITSFARGTIINNCYNTGNVSCITEDNMIATGGLVGAVQLRCTITNCYNVGDVSSVNNMGCLIGMPSSNNTVENSYYLSTCTESEYGEPKDPDYMRSQEFVDALNGPHRDQVWAMDESNTNEGFPVLTKNNLAVEEASVAAFIVYPNPAQECFTIVGTGTMRIANVLGQKIMSKEINGMETIALPKGMYFVTLNGKTQKIVVE